MRLVDIDKVKKNLDKNKPDWTAEDYAVACEDAEFYSSMEDFIAEHGDEIEMMMFAPELVPDEPKWIPCSERMPESRAVVIFTVNRGYPFVCVGFRINSEREGLKLQRWFDKLSGLNFSDYDVTAWMPMPEAYKEVAENG